MNQVANTVMIPREEYDELVQQRDEQAAMFDKLNKHCGAVERQRDELAAALEQCKQHMAKDKWDSLFIEGALAKAKP